MKQTPKILGLISALLATALGCGVTNPYENHSAKCKINCDTKNTADARSLPRQTPRIATGLDFWLDVLSKSAPVFAPQEESGQISDAVLQMLVANPLQPSKTLTTPSGFLKMVQTDFTDLRAIEQKGAANVNQQCLLHAFSAAGQTEDGVTTSSADYGKCLGLSAYQTKQSPATYEIENTSETVLTFADDTPTGTPNSLLQRSTTYPLASLPSEQTQQTASQTFRFYLEKIIQKDLTTSVGNQVDHTTRRWSLLTLGQSATSPFSVAWHPELQSITLNGTAISLAESLLNAPKDSYSSESAVAQSVIYEFQGFTISGSGVTLNSAFGFSRNASLQGSYTVQINSHLFKVEAQGIPCRTKAWLLSDGSSPSAPSDLGDLDLCSGL